MRVLTLKSVLLGLGASLMSLTSVGCNESVDTNQQRRYDNEQSFAEFASKSDYEAKTLPGLFGKDAIVYMKWLERPNPSGTQASPGQTTYVRMNYRGSELVSWLKDGSGLFSENYNESRPSPMRVSEQILGMRIALQHMQVGDKVSVAIPWYLAYGSTGKTSGYSIIIPPYLAMHFEVSLLEIVGEESNE